MNLGDIRKASASLRASFGASSSYTAAEIFSRSESHEKNDEEALKWAALEKLPTFDRLRKGLLFGSQGAIQEVDVTDLNLHERKNLLERLVNDANEDNEKFLLKLRNRLDRVGIDLPTVEVRFEHLNIEAEAFEGSRALPSFTNFTINNIEALLNYFHILPSRKRKLNVLRHISGIIKPSRMTLLLGPPASGKTTLLLELAGKLDSSLKRSGRVTFNGHGLEEFVPQRTAAYISQNDLHMGEMTVRETLEFSGRCQGVGTRYEMLAELSRREKIANIKPDTDIDFFMKAAATKGQEASIVTDYILKVLGLEVCADTMVGDEMVRGISGGQKKRVTTGEMLVGPASVLFMDEISTGLDSSTTYSIVNSLGHYVHILKGTALISLLQPAPETYDLFDDVILLSEGIIVYGGPREHVLEFFESMGFKCPERKGVADFLQEVTSKKDQKQYWAKRDEPYRFVTVNKFAEAFQSFHVGQRQQEELSIQFDKSKSHAAALRTEKYGVSKMELLKACTSRELLLMKRNMFVYYFKIFQISFMAIITMTVFLRTKMHRRSLDDGQIFCGALFFSIVMIMFNGMSEMALTILKLPVFYKQRDHLMYPSWAYGLPIFVLKIPVSFLEVAVWVFVTYYVIGFDPNAGTFFKQYLLFLLLQQVASALFRFIGAVARTLIIGNTFGAYILLLIFALNGFVLGRDGIKKWWLWGYWSSPLMYGLNAAVVNEFKGNSWKHVAPNSTEALGDAILKSKDFFTVSYWYWIGIGASFGFIILYNFLFVGALTYFNAPAKSQAIMLEDNDESKDVQTKGNGRRTENTRNGMVLPFEPQSMTFDEIVYSVDMPQEMKDQGAVGDKLVLLNGLSGTFRPGVLTALMGVSGAGKTTLMDVLAGRKTGGYIDGSITISGYQKKQDTFARISGYCEQNDIHSPYVTIYESLVYSAWLRLPPEVDSKSRKMFVEEVMELVELTPLGGALVGLPGVNGLSTEQRKRLTIAVELVANPSIIFMDEPTSGLDARAAAIVMRTVRNTVDTGRTVVCTIHQPSIDIFESFDELFLLKRGGQEIYVGPLGRHSSQLINYFEGIRGISKIKDGYNPATWMLEVTSPSQEMNLGIDFTDVFRNSDLYRRNKALINELSRPRPGTKDLTFPTKYSRTFLIQCLACLWKQRQSYWRNTNYTAVRFWFTIFIALTFGTMFWDLGGKMSTKQNLLNAMGSMFAAVTFLGLQNGTAIQPVVDVERTVFYRERAAGMYSALPYAFGQIVIELPYIVAQAFAYGVIVYAMIGFEWTATKFFWNIFFLYFTLLYFTLYGMMTVAVTPSPHIAAIIATAFYALWNLFSGFVIPRPSIPVWWRWYYWASPEAWTLYGMVASQFGDVKDKMVTGESVQEYLESTFGFRHDFVGICALMMIVLVVCFSVIFAYSIRAFNFQKR